MNVEEVSFFSNSFSLSFFVVEKWERDENQVEQGMARKVIFPWFPFEWKLFMRRWWIKKSKKKNKLRMCCLTYSLTSRNLSPSLATHRPRLLITEPLKVIGCCSPDWNQDPFHCEGKTQFVVDAEMKRRRKTLIFFYHEKKFFCTL